MSSRWLKKEEYGKVPRYLQNIKVGLAQQHAEKQAAKEAAMVPPGMRIMPEEERLEMLGILDESRQDVEAKLQVTIVCVFVCVFMCVCMCVCVCVRHIKASDQSVSPAEVCIGAVQSYLFVDKSYGARCFVSCQLRSLHGMGLLLVVIGIPGCDY